MQRIPGGRDARGEFDALLHADVFRVEELADLLDIDQAVIRSAVYSGALRAEKLGHEIVSIRREDALSWLRHRPHR